ncbi:MAG: choice-of-anchor J domain-containing protein [Candidatus Cloacimonetes bacterium]|nr:choice-of-anchor J domain-containing protein [Candidatus Cloacimonadota bacterium]
MKKKLIIFVTLMIALMSLNAIGGDSFATAVQIMDLPFSDSGDTNSLSNTVANPSNDAIYLLNSFLPLTNMTISMMGSSFDTYLWIYAADMTTVLWSNDDYGGTVQSQIDNISITADTNYYIVAEGYSSQNGSYSLNITSNYSGPIFYSSMYPPEIDFGIIDVNTISPVEVLTLENHGEAPITILQAPTLTGDNVDQFVMTDMHTYPLTIQIDGSINISFSFHPTSQGHKSALLTIVDDQTETDRTVNEIQLVGYSQLPDNNNTASMATELTLDTEGYETILNSDDDIDWYVFWQTAPANIDIHTERIYGSTVDVAAFLYGPYDDLGMNIDEFDPYAFDDDSWSDGISPHIMANVTESGFYYLRIADTTFSPVREDRLETMDYALWVISDNHNPPPGMMPPLNLEAQITYQGVFLVWDSPDAANRSLVGYNIYRNETLINSSLITSAFYEDWAENLTENQVYEYEVTAVYTAPSGESEPSNTVSVTYIQVDPPLIAEDFESYDNFATSFGNWILTDVDEQNTLGFVMGIDFPGENSPMAFMIFNPTATTPALQNTTAYSGVKCAASFSADTGASDDWMMSPQIQLADGFSDLSFLARSYSIQYGFEQLEIAISYGSTDPQDFIVISGEQPLDVPLSWTPYSFDLSDYSNTVISLGIHSVSNHRFILMIDDVMINGIPQSNDEIVPANNEVVVLKNNYPNPFNPETTIAFDLKEAGEVNLEVYNMRGQKVTTLAQGNFPVGSHSVVWKGTDSNGKSVTSGVYFYKLQAGTYTFTKKMILIK